MQRYYELFYKLNDISKYIGAIFLVILVVDSLIFTLIPLKFLKYLGIGLVAVYLLGYLCYRVFGHHCCFIISTDSPKSHLWTFKDFLDCYNGKIYDDYFSSCDDYDFFENAMDTFSGLFDDDGKDNFGKICQHFKLLYEDADDEYFIYDEKNYHDNDKKNMIKNYAYHFLIMKYNQLSNYVKSHNYDKLWNSFEHNIDNNWETGNHRHIKKPNALQKDTKQMYKVVES